MGKLCGRGIVIMGQLFGKSRESRWTDPRTRSGYVSPFIENSQQKKQRELAKWEMVARMIKKRGNKSSIKEIATELYEADQKRRGL